MQYPYFRNYHARRVARNTAPRFVTLVYLGVGVAAACTCVEWLRIFRTLSGKSSRVRTRQRTRARPARSRSHIRRRRVGRVSKHRRRAPVSRLLERLNAAFRKEFALRFSDFLHCLVGAACLRREICACCCRRCLVRTNTILWTAAVVVALPFLCREKYR